MKVLSVWLAGESVRAERMERMDAWIAATILVPGGSSPPTPREGLGLPDMMSALEGQGGGVMEKLTK